MKAKDAFTFFLIVLFLFILPLLAAAADKAPQF